MVTTKRAPVYVDETGVIYEQLPHQEALRNPDAVREILPSADGKQAKIRWLLPIGVLTGSDAAADAAVRHAEETFKANSQ